MDIIQKLRSVIGYYTPVKKQDVSSNYPNHEMSSFIKLLEEVNWSRGYGWFVEMEDAPYPFNGSSLGLPVTDVTFVDMNTEEYSWDGSTNKYYVPKSRNGGEEIQLNLIDDEQATMFSFFEDWMNDIYDPYNGVLPLTEACKKITIHRFTSERYRVKRLVNGTPVEGYTYFVYPYQMLSETLDYNSSDPVKFTIQLRIVGHADLKSTITETIANKVTTNVDGKIINLGY